MRRLPATLRLAVLCLLIGVADFRIAPTDASPASSGLSNLVAVPDWFEQGAPVVASGSPAPTHAGLSNPACSSAIWLPITYDKPVVRTDCRRAITELYAYDGANDRIARFDIDSCLDTTVVSLPNLGLPWIVEDLDRDGRLDMVTQRFEELAIYSEPDWSPRASFIYPGAVIVFQPVVTNLNADKFLEVILAPHGFGGEGQIVVIAFDSLAGSFREIVNYPAPFAVNGRSVAADFDNDGRIEYVIGGDEAYHLYEWQDSTLAFIGPVGGPPVGNHFHAAAVRPKPDGLAYLLLGFSNAQGTGVYHYELLRPTGNNIFTLEHTFSLGAGSTGIHPCEGADVDCDGMDELAMGFGFAGSEEWEWDPATSGWVQTCVWVRESFGTIVGWYPVDLDWDGRQELGNTTGQFRAFHAGSCVDGNPLCEVNGPRCCCQCHADPRCDGQVDLVDVIEVIGIAFRGMDGIPDPNVDCPHETTDVNCSYTTDVVDVVKIVNVAFRGADASAEFCAPCPLAL